MLNRIITFLEDNKYSNMGLPDYYIARDSHSTVTVYICASNPDWIKEHAAKLAAFANLEYVFSYLWRYDAQWGAVTVEYIAPIAGIFVTNTRTMPVYSPDK